MRRPLLRAGVSGLCFAAAAVLAVPAGAEGQPGSGFFGFTLTAQAHGLQLTEDQPSANSHPEADVELPDSAVSLTAGPVGYGLSSVAWPGALAGNAGSLVLLVRPDAPQEVKTLNDPVRAEARTGSAQNEVTNDTVPGARMHAKALPSAVTADALIDGGTAGGTAGFGRTTSVSTVTLGAATGAAVADSTVKDLSFAGGVVAISSVTSHAEAVTDGTTATAKGVTSVSGMTVAGVPVTVDERGVRVAGTSAADPVSTETVNSALATIGMTIALSTPSRQTDGGTVRYDAGSLILNWKPPQSVNVFTASVGGARVVASANAGSAPGAVVVPPPYVAPTGGRPAAPPVYAPLPDVAPETAPGTDVAAPVPTVGAGGPQPQAVAQSEERPLLDGTGIPLPAALLALFGALVLLSGLVRVPGLLLLSPPSARCPLEEDS